MSAIFSMCQTCLSSDRRLLPLNYISDLLIEVNMQHLHQYVGAICWECHSILAKFARFKQQVKYSQTYLTKCNKLNLELKTLSKLTSDIKTFYDAQIIYDYSKKSAEEALEIKDEKVDSVDVNYDLATSVYVESLNDTEDLNEVSENSNGKNDIELKRKRKKCAVSKITKDQNNYKVKYTKKVVFQEAEEAHLKTNCNKKFRKHKNTISVNLNEDGVKPITDDISVKKLLNNEKDDKPLKTILIKTITKDLILDKSLNDQREINKIEKEVVIEEITKGDGIKAKYVKVIYTEEEMLRNREDKRKGYNFQKIPYKCDTCVLGFLRKTYYDAHLVKKHSENIGIHKCAVCEIRFENLIALNRHTEKHYTCYKCKLCKYECVELWSILNHCKLKHKGDTRDSIHCKECAVVCKSPEDLTQHMMKEHFVTCNECAVVCKSPEDLTQHMMKEHFVTCNECAVVCKSPEDLTQHMMKEHFVTCNECGAKFKGKHTLGSHMRRIHRSNRQFSCQICKLTFKSNSRLESHMFRHGAQQSYCRVCKVQYSSVSIFRNHLANSKFHANQMYQCPECDKKFASEIYWKKHFEFFHLKKSKFSCQKCDKLFMSGWSLNRHQQIAHGKSRVRNYECNICGNKFYTSATLKGHKLIHSEERKFMCSVCGDTFKQQPSLYTHTKLVHKGVKKKPKQI